MHVAAAEALALIFEIDRLEKFLSADDISLHGGDTALHSVKQKLKNNIAKQLRSHSMKASNEDSAEKDTIRMCKSNLDVLKYFEVLLSFIYLYVYAHTYLTAASIIILKFIFYFRVLLVWCL